ncbi:hypothetical protein GWK47_028331 [Chionoecetes opilio]|uniref:Uncharacterized protein n=1 Tax=Chionoecetes opilio TaxID=41210 RepID=A0A8J4YYU0_CHIOP|nr:hypothetical protein GWK47_028331 [Chionoecetes opilio]
MLPGGVDASRVGSMRVFETPSREKVRFSAGEVRARWPLPSPPATTRPASAAEDPLVPPPASPPRTSHPHTRTSSMPGTPAGVGELVSQVLRSNQETQDLLRELLAVQKEAVATKEEKLAVWWVEVEVQRGVAETLGEGVEALSELAALATWRDKVRQ